MPAGEREVRKAGGAGVVGQAVPATALILVPVLHEKQVRLGACGCAQRDCCVQPCRYGSSPWHETEPYFSYGPRQVSARHSPPVTRKIVPFCLPWLSCSIHGLGVLMDEASPVVGAVKGAHGPAGDVAVWKEMLAPQRPNQQPFPELALPLLSGSSARALSPAVELHPCLIPHGDAPSKQPPVSAPSLPLPRVTSFD